MRRSLVRVALYALFLAAGCTRSSPTAPTPPPPPPPAGTAAAITLTPNTWDLPAGGGKLEIVIATSANAAGNVAAPNVPVTLLASSGSLSNETPQTDSTGHARVTWSGTSSATITARAGDVQGVANIRVPVPPTTPPAPGPNPGPTPPGPTTPTDPPKPPDDGGNPPGPARDLVATITPTPANPEAGVEVTYQATLTSSTGATVPAISFHVWDLNGDRLPDHFEEAPKITYTTPGTIVVELELRTADNRAVHATLPVTVAPAPGIAATLASDKATAALGETVTLTASATTVGDVGTLSYAWDFNADGTVDTTTATSSTTHAFTSIGTQLPRVTVIGTRGGSATASTPVTISAPALSVSAFTVSGTTTANNPVTFHVDVVADGGAPVPSPLKFAIDYGDGSSIITSLTPLNVPHIYNVAGKYTVKVTVTAADGRTATATITVVIS